MSWFVAWEGNNILGEVGQRRAKTEGGFALLSARLCSATVDSFFLATCR